MRKKVLSIILIIVLAFCACACGGGEEMPKEPGENQVLDGADRIVDIPEDPSSATLASVYAVAVPFMEALDITDRVLAVNTKSEFWTDVDRDLDNAGTVGRGVVDLEALAKYNPTVLVHRSNDPTTVESVEKLGIDVLCITVEDMEDIKYTLRMMGRYFGAEEKAEYVVSWIDKQYSDISEIVASIPEEEKKTALLMGGELGRVAGNDMLQTWMIEQAGGLPSVDTGKDHNWVDVGVEKVFDYNPDVIFCTSSTARDYTTEELLEDSAWSAVKAVKNEEIYVIPSKYDSWDMPGISAVLGTLYMLYRMYPDYFTEEEFREKIDEYYTFMFGRTFDSDYLGYDISK